MESETSHPEESGRPKRILFAGSSHTRLFFPHVLERLGGRALAERLPFDAGRTDEILASLPRWPVQDKDAIHLYAGLRDLALNEYDAPYVGPEQFRANLICILEAIRGGTGAILVLSNIPSVSVDLLTVDPAWNERISLYNGLIEEVAREAGVPVHDFRGFAASYREDEKFLDGLHFTDRFYRDFGYSLADYLMRLMRAG